MYPSSYLYIKPPQKYSKHMFITRLLIINLKKLLLMFKGALKERLQSVFGLSPLFGQFRPTKPTVH